MSNEIDIRLLDRRTVERYLARGEITQKDVEKYLKQLPDLSDQLEVVPLEQPTSHGVPTR